ncbi:MAG: SdiA-regulated domain-containing protein [Rhodocyclales bacterium]|nr:SdiA-regulated domain-containing protein [Rhodocyclales bacterium]
MERRLGILDPNRVIAIDDFPEISGIAYWAERGTLIGVGDNGEIAEITLQGKVLRKRMHRDRDFEDVALLDQPGLALAIDEQHNQLLTVRLADFEIVAQAGVPNGFSLTRHRNKSFEALALTGQPPRLVLGNEFPPAVARFGTDRIAPPHTVLLGARSISGVLPGPQGELLVVSRENGLLLLDADGNAVGDGWRPVPYRFFEGAAMVPGVGLVLCVDRNPGILLIFSSLQDWPALRHAFAS